VVGGCPHSGHSTHSSRVITCTFLSALSYKEQKTPCRKPPAPTSVLLYTMANGYPGPLLIRYSIQGRSRSQAQQYEKPEMLGPQTPQKQTGGRQRGKPSLARQTPKHGWCPKCEFGHRILDRFPPWSGEHAGKRKFWCSNKDRNCDYFEAIPGDAVIETGNATPMRQGNCPQCRKGNLVEMPESVFNYKVRHLECERKDAPERPCNYRRDIGKSKPTPRGTKSSPLGPIASPIRKSTAADKPSHLRKSPVPQMSRPLRRSPSILSPASSPGPATVHTPGNDVSEPAFKPSTRSLDTQKASLIPTSRPVSSFALAPKATANIANERADDLGQPISSKTAHQNRAGNPVASTSQWLRRIPTTGPLQAKGVSQQLPSAAATGGGASRALTAINLTEDVAPPRTPLSTLPVFYPTPETSKKTKGRNPTATPAIQAEDSDEFDCGLDDDDLLEVADQVERSVRRAKSKTPDYGSFDDLDDDEIQELARITDELAAKPPRTPAGKKPAGGLISPWTPKTGRAQVSSPGQLPGPRTPTRTGMSTNGSAKAPWPAAARHQFQRPPTFRKKAEIITVD